MPLTSPPAQNAPPAPVSTTQPTSSATSTSASTRASAWFIAPDIALRRSGRFIVSVATPSATSASRSSVPVSIVRMAGRYARSATQSDRSAPAPVESAAIEEQARTPRAEEIVARARDIIERGAGDRLTMRRLADEMGIQAPSLYKHFPDKGAIQRAVYVDYLTAMRDALVRARQAVEDPAHPLARVARAYRAHGLGNRELYAYVHVLPYPRAEAAGVLKDIRMQWFLAAGHSDLALADVRVHARHGRAGDPLPDAAGLRGQRRVRAGPCRVRRPRRAARRSDVDGAQLTALASPAMPADR